MGAIHAHAALLAAMSNGGGSGGDPDFASVVALLHFDGVDGSTTFADVVGNSWGVTSPAQIDTAQSKFGGASGYFDGSGAAISSTIPAAVFGTADLTVEFWVRPSTISGTYQCLVANQAPFAAGNWGVFQFQEDIMVFSNGSQLLRSALPAAELSPNTWYHIAWVRAGGVNKLYIDGVLGDTLNAATNYTSGALVIGSAAGYHLAGHLDDVRITNGVARYTPTFPETFTPPTAAFPDA